MEIKLPATLTAVYYSYDSNYNTITGPGRVVVSFGKTVVTELKAVSEPGQYYDAGLNEESEQDVVEETVALWLREKLS